MRPICKIGLQPDHLSVACFDQEGLGTLDRLTAPQHMGGRCFDSGILAIFCCKNFTIVKLNRSNELKAHCKPSLIARLPSMCGVR